MVESAQEKPRAIVADLYRNPNFAMLPFTEKRDAFKKAEQDDPEFRSLSSADQEYIYNDLMTQIARGVGAPIEQMREAVAGLQPAQPAPPLADIKRGQPQGEPSTLGEYGRGVAQGAVRTVEGVVTGIPELYTRAMEPVTRAATRGLGKLVGSEELANYPGHTEEQFRAAFHPVETVLTGGKGFTLPQGTGPQLVQRVVEGIGGIALGGALLQKAGVLAETLPLTPTIVQGIGAALGGQSAHEILQRADPETQKALTPWLGFVSELVGQVGAQSAAQVVQGIYQHLPKQTVTRAEQEALQRTRPAEGTTPAGRSGTQTNIEDVAQPFQSLVPEANRATAGMLTGSPELRAAEEYVAAKRPDVGVQLEDVQRGITRGVQRAVTEPLGTVGLPEAELAVETVRAPLRSAQHAEVAETKTRGRVEDFAEISRAQAAKDTAAAARQVATEKKRLALAEEQLDTLKTQQKETLEKQLAAISRAAATRAGLSGAPPDPRIAAATRQDFAVKVRQATERAMGEFQQTAHTEASKIDPRGLASAPPEILEDALQVIQDLALSEGRQVPSAIGRIRGIIDEVSPKPKAPPLPEPGTLGAVPTLAPSGVGRIPAPEIPPEPRNPLTFQNLRDARTALLEEARSDPGSNDARMIYALLDKLDNVQGVAATNAAALGDSSVKVRSEAFSAFYREGIRPFVESPGTIILAKEPSAGNLSVAKRLAGAVGDERDYRYDNAQLIGAIIGPSPRAGAPAAGGQKLGDFQVVAGNLAKEPGGIDALKDFFAHDFYGAVYNPRTQSANRAKVDQWLRDRAQYIDAVPALKAQFSTIRGQKTMLDRAEANSMRLLRQAEAPLPAAKSAVETAREAQAQARLSEIDVGEQLGNIVQRARDAETRAMDATADALARWKDIFGASNNVTAAQNKQYVSDILGIDAETLISQIAGRPAGQARYQLSQLASNPRVKNDPQALSGITRMLYEHEFGGDLTRLTPTRFAEYLDKWGPWLDTFMPAGYVKDLRTINKGFNQMLGSEVGRVPGAMQEMTPHQRVLTEAGTGFGTGAAAIFGRASLGHAIGLGYLAKYGMKALDYLTDERRLNLVQAALFDPQAAHLVALAQTGRAPASYVRTLADGVLSRYGGAASALGATVGEEAP